MSRSAPPAGGSTGPEPEDLALKILLRLVGLLLVGLLAAAPVALTTFLGTERAVTIGAHNASASPTLDGHVTILAGPLLPELRLPTGAPFGLGAEVVLRDSPDTDLNAVLAQDAAIASQPDGERAALTDDIREMAGAALVRGGAVGVITMVLTVVLWSAVGSRRRRELLHAWPPSRRTVGVGTALFAVLAAAVWVYLPSPSNARTTTWVPIREEFPELPAEPALDRVEISQGAATAGSRAVVQGALDTYRESLTFYSALAEKAQGVKVREPEDGQTTAIVVTDRHDNVGMDPVAKTVADAARASFVIDLGDDTSNGASWEAFSLNSLREQFADLPIVAVAGNHDQGREVKRAMRRNDFIVLDGKPVEVEGVRILGDSDPRSSGLTAGYNGNESDNISAVRRQSARLADTACEDGNVSLLMTHSAASARDTIEQGCVDLSLSGHLHRQVGPTVTTGPEGTTTSMSLGSTGGAVYAFALGTKLRRDAQVAVLTFEDEGAVGLQVVTFEPGGIIAVGEYTPIAR